MTIEETCKQLKEEIDSKLKVEKKIRQELKYKTDGLSVMQSLRYFKIINNEQFQNWFRENNQLVKSKEYK